MSRVRLRLPATSANLGSGFDSVAVALKLYLNIDASQSEHLAVRATGRNADLCGASENNLFLDTYRSLLGIHGRDFVPLHIEMHNEIPLGMGCGSSAAVRLAAVALASHFGGLAWSRERILFEASRLEGHPDNAAACWLGGFVAGALEDSRIRALSLCPPQDWVAILVMPDHPLATMASRAVLPATYPREDVVSNLQRVALLTAAFAAGRADLLSTAMADRLHQPFRAEVCPLLPRLLPLAGVQEIAGVALSGAGPAVLLLTSRKGAAEGKHLVLSELDGTGVEILLCELENGPAKFEEESGDLAERTISEAFPNWESER